MKHILNVPGTALNSSLKDLTLGLETNLKVICHDFRDPSY